MKQSSSVVFNAHADGGKQFVANQISQGRYVFGIQSLEAIDPVYDSESYQALNIEIDDVDSMVHALKSLTDDESIQIDEVIFVESGKTAMDKALRIIVESYCMAQLPGVRVIPSSDPLAMSHGDPIGLTGLAGTPGQP